MKPNNTLTAYKHKDAHSYASGAYAVIELLNACPERALAVYIHSACNDKAGMERLCRERGVPVRYGDKAFGRINQKENSYVLGVFEKRETALDRGLPHILLAKPGDMGNLGTIVRAAVGFGITDLGIITPGADIWHPKTVRASMGAVFRVNIRQFPSVGDYMGFYPGHSLFPFMLDGKLNLRSDNCPQMRLFTLIFGNEAAGLDAEYHDLGTSVRIEQTAMVDSLNIAVAAGVGMFMFACTNQLV